jgi:hypothetical protein
MDKLLNTFKDLGERRLSLVIQRRRFLVLLSETRPLLGIRQQKSSVFPPL